MPGGDETKAAATSTSDGQSAAQSAAVASIAPVTATAASTQRRASPVAVRASFAQAAIIAKEVASRGAGAVRAIHAGMGIMAIRRGGLSIAVARIAMKRAASIPRTLDRPFPPPVEERDVAPSSEEIPQLPHSRSRERSRLTKQGRAMSLIEATGDVKVGDHVANAIGSSSCRSLGCSRRWRTLRFGRVDRLATIRARVRTAAPCGSAWNKDPVSGLIGVQKGPP